MLKRFWERMLPWMEALDGADDPMGEFIMSLDARVRKLEIAIAAQPTSSDTKEAMAESRPTSGH